MGLHVKYPNLVYVRFQWNFNILDRFYKNAQISNFMKIRPVGAEMFHWNGQTYRYDEANGRSSQFCEHA